jgi:hypothetical protein
MPIPVEILSVERPKNTRVKKSGEKYLVIKRTCKRVNGRNVPVELGTIGEIVNGKYIEKRKEPRSKAVDVKDYGEVALCDKCSGDLLQELADVWDISDAKRLLVIALLRAAYGDVRDRDLQMRYQTSFLSEMYPRVHLSENAVSAFLNEIGAAYSMIAEFMRNRISAFAGGRLVVDGMLKDYNSETGSMSEFSRKALHKGSKDVSLMYAFDPTTREPIAAKPYPGNMLDSTAVGDFIEEYGITRGLMVFDKGFHGEALFEQADRHEGLSYLIPLKGNSKLIGRYGLDEPGEKLEGYNNGTVLYKKVRMSNGKYLYAYRDTRAAFEQETGYVERLSRKKGGMDPDAYLSKRSRFGLIVFQSKDDLPPLIVYLAYLGRWDIEVLFGMYKNIIERDTVNVHGDYRLYATELINFISVIISTRVRKTMGLTMVGVKKKLAASDIYSYKQIFLYLSKYKMVRTTENGKWHPSKRLKYIEELCQALGI